MVNEFLLYIAPPFPLLTFSVKLEATISAFPLLYTTEFVFMTLLENSAPSMNKFPSFKTIALLMELSENTPPVIFKEPELYMIDSVSKAVNVQFLSVKLP